MIWWPWNLPACKLLSVPLAHCPCCPLGGHTHALVLSLGELTDEALLEKVRPAAPFRRHGFPFPVSCGLGLQPPSPAPARGQGQAVSWQASVGTSLCCLPRLCLGATSM